MHLVVKGRFAVRIVTPLGDGTTLAVVGRGGFYGELALLGDGGRARHRSRRSTTPATRAVHKLDFNRLRGPHPEVSEVLVRALAARVGSLSEQVERCMSRPSAVCCAGCATCTRNTATSLRRP